MTKVLEFLSRAVVDKVKGSTRTCQRQQCGHWRERCNQMIGRSSMCWQLNPAVNNVKLVDDQSEDGVSEEKSSCR